ncbi:hypothetical protein PG993_011908 [Apiospora rasikravindrae]|uniref:BTB domain-containing protein n=1 Tax=Apiospora rasikravindrae TaxID=990691 RepID=A0ABR1S2A2_9PEZI
MSSGFKLMRKSGEELLNSGLFSDAEVITDAKTWRVHKNILCSRSAFFKKAFTGGFVEAQDGVVKLHGHDPDHVYFILKYLYTCNLDTSTLELSKLFKIYEAADYFGIDELQADILHAVGIQLRYKARSICLPNRDMKEAIEHVGEHWSDKFSKEFFDAARIAYTDSPVFEKLRKCIIKFIRQTCLILGKDPRFIKALETVPELAVDMVELIMDTKNEGNQSMVCREWPTKCDECHSSGKELYKNELFADAELVAGDEKWPIHKGILCTRSKWFKKALAGPFKEATTNKVDITGHDPKYVDLVLRFLYTGQGGRLDA